MIKYCKKFIAKYALKLLCQGLNLSSAARLGRHVCCRSQSNSVCDDSKHKLLSSETSKKNSCIGVIAHHIAILHTSSL